MTRSNRAAAAAMLLMACATMAAPPGSVPPSEALIPELAATKTRFGESIAVDGDWVAISAPGRTVGVTKGAVDIFRTEPDGAWTLVQSVNIEGIASAQEFGLRVALKNDWLAVAAAKRNGSQILYAPIFMFHRNESGVWEYQQTIEPTHTNSWPDEPSALLFFGDRLLMGRGKQAQRVIPGRVMSFSLIGDSWVEQGDLPIPLAGDNEQIGFALATSGARLFVGAPTRQQHGRVLVLTHDGSRWVLQQELAPESSVKVRFGASLAADAEWLLVGSPEARPPGRTIGRVDAYALPVDLDPIGAPSQIRPHTLEVLGRFGESLAISGDRAAVRMERYQSFHKSGIEDSIITFAHGTDGWSQGVGLFEVNAPPSKYFGEVLRFAGHQLIAGNPDSPVDSIGEVGRVLVWDSVLDCDGDGIFDPIAIAAGRVSDCDRNGNPDSCDIAFGVHLDSDQTGAPDVCAADCDGDGVPDRAAISSGLSHDCNLDGVPDECQDLPCVDVNSNSVPDSEELASGMLEDCDEDGWPDLAGEYDALAAPGFATSILTVSNRFFCHRLTVRPDAQRIDRIDFRMEEPAPVGTLVIVWLAIDPNDDGDFSDTTLLGTWLARTKEPGHWVTRWLTQPVTVPPGSGLIVGIGCSNQTNMALGRTAECSGAALPFSPGCGRSHSFLATTSVFVNDPIAIAKSAASLAVLSWVPALRAGAGDCLPRCDLTGDGVVDGADLAFVLGSWGPAPGWPVDLDSNGSVGFSDVELVLEHWSG